jgi:protein-disulfide isomerase
MHRIVFFLFAACATGEPPVSVAAEPTTAPAAEEESGKLVVGSWKGGSFTLGEVEEDVSGQIRMAKTDYLTKRHQLTSGALDELIAKTILEAEAKERGLADVDALLKAEVESKMTEPTEEEIAGFYEMVKRQVRGAPLDVVRPQIVQELQKQQLGAAYGVLVDGLRKKYKVEAKIPFPDLPKIDVELSDHDPFQGKEDAKVTIVQFAEYECYYCGQAAPTLDKVRETYGDDVRVVFKDFPLEMHQRAMPAAVAAHCAGEQDKYWEMNRIMLANQQALQDSDFANYVAQFDMDAGKFDACMASGRYESTVRADMAAGMAAGVQATPTFFVNGVLLSGAQPFEQFQAVIDRELKN